MNPLRGLGVAGVMIALLTGCVVATRAALDGEEQLQLDERFQQWSRYEGEAGVTHFSALDQINRSNVHQLQIAWTFNAAGGASYNPIIIDTVMYVLGPNSSVVALHAATGQEIWRHTSEVPGGISGRGIMYWESPDRSDRRLLFTKGSHDLLAIDARTGQPIRTFGNGGRVDTREGLGRDPSVIPRSTSGSPGVIFDNLVIMGSAPGEGYVSGPGHIRAFDVRTGRLAWVFHTIPYPGEFGNETWPEGRNNHLTTGGTNTWGGMSVDLERGIVYVPLGSASYDFYGIDRLGENLFANSLVALDARTGRRIWHFQTIHHDLWDYDLTASPVLLTVENEGRMVDAVVQAGKTGFVYAFDRVSGRPLWPIEERPVAPSRMPGEIAWPTQPHPTKPAPFVPQTFSIFSDLSPHLQGAERDSMVNRLSRMLNLGLFTPPDTQATLQIPGNRGGANWGSTGGDPRDGTFYVLSYNMPSILKLERITPGATGTGGSAIDRGQTVYQVNCQICHGPELRGNPNSGVPSLEGVTERLSHDELQATVRSGGANMPAFPQLSTQEFDALQAYLGSPHLALTQGTQPVDGAAFSGPVRYQSGWNHILDSRGVPAIRPPWFRLTAYDMNRGEIKWQVPIGEVPHLAAAGMRNTGASVFLRGGPAITGGDLIFIGTENRLRALDKDTGREIWSAQLPANAGSTPAVYEVDGRQYVVISLAGAGGGGPGGGGGGGGGAPAAGAQQPQPTPGYVAFALPVR